MLARLERHRSWVFAYYKSYRHRNTEQGHHTQGDCTVIHFIASLTWHVSLHVSLNGLQLCSQTMCWFKPIYRHLLHSGLSTEDTTAAEKLVLPCYSNKSITLRRLHSRVNDVWVTIMRLQCVSFCKISELQQGHCFHEKERRFWQQFSENAVIEHRWTCMFADRYVIWTNG